MNPDRLLTLLPHPYRPPLRWLSITLVCLGLFAQTLDLLQRWHFALLPLIQIALIAHLVEAALGFWVAPRHDQPRLKTAIGVFFTGAIGLADLVDPPTPDPSI